MPDPDKWLLLAERYPALTRLLHLPGWVDFAANLPDTPANRFRCLTAHCPGHLDAVPLPVWGLFATYYWGVEVTPAEIDRWTTAAAANSNPESSLR